MKIVDLLSKDILGLVPGHFADKEIVSLTADSRKVIRGSLFFALPGAIADGENFIPQAIAKGARVIIKSKKLPDRQDSTNDVCVISVPDPQKVFRELVFRYFGPLSKKVKVIGITGTNGKTTVSYLCESILQHSGHSCGVVGTVNYRYRNKTIPSNNTTPGLIENQEFLSKLSGQNIGYCVMEVSSHALDQGRVDLIDFQTAIFTNLTSDHLDYHADREDYFQAKAKMFTRLTARGKAVVNADDPYGIKLLKLVKTSALTYGFSAGCDISAQNVKYQLAGSIFTLKTPNGTIDISTPLVGPHNVYNVLAAAGMGIREGISLNHIKQGVESLKTVPGRLESVNEGQDFHVFIDYAHTEDALKNVLSSIKKVSDAKIILVFGCGGDRDQTKRPLMGKVASQLADLCILTNDNPRTEDPESIVEQITKGFVNENYMTILDRQKAIEESLRLAQTGDVVLIAGKGHEDYQIFKDQRIHFDDAEVTRRCLRLKKPQTKHAQS